MKKTLLQWLRCPACYGEIVLDQQSGCIWDDGAQDLVEGRLRCISCNAAYPVKNSIPRFSGDNNYTDNFGFYWNIFNKTHLDSYTKLSYNKNMFLRQWGSYAEGMDGALMLDAGCGAGKFAEIALSTGATVIAVDHSRAVDACSENLKSNIKLHVVQADIDKLPFKNELFDYIYSFNVLQHTPDTKKSFFNLARKARRGGKMCVDVYKKDWRIYFWPKYWIRPFTRNMRPETLFKIVRNMTPPLLSMSNLLNRIPRAGRFMKYIIPVANYESRIPLDKKQLLEWSILDTFDMYSAKYDFPHSEKAVGRWFKEAGFLDTEVFYTGHVVGRGKNG